MPTVRFLSGDEAAAWGAYEEGLKVACSYPGTPATEILETLATFPEVDAQWSVNEKVAFEVSLSASIAGLRSLFAAKHVGLNVAMDALMTSAYTGVNAGFIIISCDDPGIHSSQNEQDNRLFAKVAKIPLLEPASPSEAKKYTAYAFTLSERFDTPVLLRMTTRIAHTKENVRCGIRKEFVSKSFTLDPAKYVMVPRNAYARHSDLEKRMSSLVQYSEKMPLHTEELGSRKIGFITSGISYLYAKEMYPQASFLKLGMTFPLPQEKIKAFAKKVQQVFVLEELEPFLEEEIQRFGVRCKAKHPSFRVGELRPELIPTLVAGKSKKTQESSARRPVFCPGCPHRAVFWVLKKMKLVVAGDIGCYTLGALPPLSSLHTCLCMGSGVTFLEGFCKRGDQKVVGVVGDSTFIHSGIPGLINLSYNKASGVLLILDNSTTAMTGNQPHPGMGITLKKEPTKKLILEDVCLACGADTVDIVNPFCTKDLEELLKKRITEKKLSVIICRFPCFLLERKKSRVPLLQKESCKKCYLCLGVHCPALSKTADGSVEINALLCTGCGLCVQACSFGALKVHE